ncbi:hypothetical protein GF420_02055 [candidate division GN15 bacterium]|nr:hypothetical protein [candidate division GN15 bacterium]
MTIGDKQDALADRLTDFTPDEHTSPRLTALFAAAVTLAEPAPSHTAISLCRRFDIPRHHLYEIVLQSYLFLGFPRMLEAADVLHSVWPAEQQPSELPPVSADEADEWFTRGEQLCRRVYTETYEPLRRRVVRMAPEVFRWMIFEGYGKVLSREGLDMIDRELAIISFLMVENRPRQLHSHIKGAVNIGADPAVVSRVLEELRPVSPDGYSSARIICDRLEIR